MDPGQIEQVIVNLAVNSRDAMPKGGRLTIEVGQQEVGGLVGYVMVRDEGTGIPDDNQAPVRAVFHDESTGKGTGLGLSIVYGIVNQAGGTSPWIPQSGEARLFASSWRR